MGKKKSGCFGRDGKLLMMAGREKHGSEDTPLRTREGPTDGRAPAAAGAPTNGEEPTERRAQFIVALQTEKGPPTAKPTRPLRRPALLTALPEPARAGLHR